MADRILDSDNAVSEVAKENAKRLREEKVLGTTINKFGREVIVTRKKYAHMRKCGDLLVDLDGNQARFKKLTDKDMDGYKNGKIAQNKQIATSTPEDMRDIEGDSKATAKAKEDMEAKVKAVADKEAELEAKAKELEAKAKELEAKEKALAEKEAKEKSEAPKAPTTPTGNTAPTNK